jgi:small Trp-rich protein
LVIEIAFSRQESIMPFVMLGVILLIMKLLEVGPVATWSWLWVLAPFGIAFIWWEAIVPLIGWDKRQAEAKMKKEQAEQQAWKKKTRGF